MSSSTDKFVQKSLEKISDPLHKHHYSVLVEIRTKVIKNKKGIEALIRHGAVRTLTKLLGTDTNNKHNEKLTDISLSIIGNLCMEEDARRQITSHTVEVLSEVLNSSKQESIQNRCARTLANIALTKKHIDLIYRIEPDAVQKIAELLRDCKTRECILTYLRAFRLLAFSTKHIEKLLTRDAVLGITKHLASEDEEIKSTALRTLFETSGISCNHGYAGQVISAGGMPELLSLLGHADSTIAHRSLTVLSRLLENTVARPVFGATGGITKFIEILSDSETQNMDKSNSQVTGTHNDFSLVNILCLCCKDVVNRSKIRENGGLLLFLQYLKEEKFKNLHERIISALQCFLYDDISINLLLKEDLVSILLQHLQTICNFQSRVPEILCSIGTQPELTKQKMEGHSNLDFSKDRDNLEDDKTDTINLDIPLNKSLYNLDSPSYQNASVIDLPEETENVVTCKTYFPPYDEACNKSPLSTISYYSPKLSPGDYSPCVSPSPSSPSIENYAGESPEVCSSSYLCGSPEKSNDANRAMSPGGFSPDQKESTDANNQEYIFSDSEESDLCEEESSGENMPNDDVDSGESSAGICHDEKSLLDKNQISRKEKNLRSSPSPEDSELVFIPKRRKLPAKERRDCATHSENHILMLLSRVSQMAEAVTYLATEDVICCLLDYILLIDKAEPRATRILSRITKNLHCYEKLLKMKMPIIVYNKLLLSVNNASNWPELVKEGLYSLIQPEVSTNESFTSPAAERNKRKDSYLDVDHEELDQDSITARKGGFDFEKACNPESDDEEYDDRLTITPPLHVLTGLLLLQDLSAVADSPYGRGVTSFILSRSDKETALIIAITLLYICWSKNMCRYLFLKHKYWTVFMDIMQNRCHGLHYFATLEGFTFIGHLADFRLRLHVVKPESLFHSLPPSPALGKISPSSSTECSQCEVERMKEKLDVFFVVDEGVRKIPASRSFLAASSEMFLAMLEGKYSESSQSCITLKDTSYYAVSYVVHYLHGCGLSCSVISDVLTCNISHVDVDNVLDVLAISHRFLITELHRFLVAVLATRFLLPAYAEHIYNFAILHDVPDLTSDCMKAVFAKGKNIYEKMTGLQTIFAGSVSDAFQTGFKSLFTE